MAPHVPAKCIQPSAGAECSTASTCRPPQQEGSNGLRFTTNDGKHMFGMYQVGILG
jgi:hypothetical protein